MKSKKTLRSCIVLALGGLMFALAASVAAAQGVGTVAATEGIVEVDRAGTLTQASPGSVLQLGDSVRTTAGRARVVFVDDTVLAIGGDTRITIVRGMDPSQPSPVSLLRLVNGRARALIDGRYAIPGAAFEIETPTAIAAVRGTEFVIVYDPVAEVTEVVGVTNEVAVNSTRDRVGNRVLVTSRELTRVERGSYPTLPIPLTETLFRQYIEDLLFIGERSSKDRGGIDPVLIGAAVADSEQASSVLAARAPTEEPLPGMGFVVIPNWQKNPLVDFDDSYRLGGLVDQPLDVIEATGADVGIEF